MVEYVDPRTRQPFPAYHSGDGNVPFPTIDGIPVLTLEPRGLLARIPRSSAFPDVRRAGVPDPITSHLAPSILGAADGLGNWFRELGETTPETVCTSFGARYAPPGPALDIGCGVGAMTRRIAVTGRETWAFDQNPDAVALARGLLTGSINQVLIPTNKGGLRRVKVPFRPLAQNVSFCIAEATNPPFTKETFAWVHLGTCLDDLGEGIADALVAASELLVTGGVLTICTAHAYLQNAEENAPSPEEEFAEAISAVGLRVIDKQDRVPAVRRDYDRQYQIRFIQCIAARK